MICCHFFQHKDISGMSLACHPNLKAFNSREDIYILAPYLVYWNILNQCETQRWLVHLLKVLTENGVKSIKLWCTHAVYLHSDAKLLLLS